jgi:phosphopantothenoylcysteine decarboxylase
MADYESIPFSASNYRKDGKRHLLLAASGSVATIKLPLIVDAFRNDKRISIRLLLTSAAAEFLQGQSHEQPSLTSIRNYPNVEGIHLDADEWKKPWVRGDPILHIELRRWADLMVIVPLSANSLAKIVAGFSDNLLLAVVRAWDTTGEIEGRTRGKKIMVAPAMNTAMWKHPVTREQIKVLEEVWGVATGGWFEVLSPAKKELTCGDVGDGAMMNWSDIFMAIMKNLESSI